jgi:hypothetical protein
VVEQGRRDVFGVTGELGRFLELKLLYSNQPIKLVCYYQRMRIGVSFNTRGVIQLSKYPGVYQPGGLPGFALHIQRFTQVLG